MIKIYINHFPDWGNDHLNLVIDDIKRTGTPTLNVLSYHKRLYVFEGSYRLVACHRLAMIPKIIVKDDVEERSETMSRSEDTKCLDFERVWWLVDTVLTEED